MIISQTPFRISLFGGGTDYPTWVQEHGGAVISTTINKYAYITCRQLPPFFEHRHRVVYSRIETVKSIADIEHPAVRAIFQEMGVREGLEVHYDGDLPARSGIGSSSSFSVGLLNALHALRGQMISKQKLAELAIHIEQNVIGEAVGSQDQVAAAFGGMNRIDFMRDGSFTVRPMIMPLNRREDLKSHLMLFFTGFSRIAATVAKSQIANFTRKADHLHAMRAMVDEAQTILQNPSADLQEIGKLLHEGWQLKRDLASNVSNSAIDEIYETGLRHGASGGKIIGAGGGGFILFFVQPEKQEELRQALTGLLEVDFKFETEGSQIIHYNPSTALYRGVRPREWGPVETAL